MAKVGAQASQVPAIVRQIRAASSDNKKSWNERVKDWQRAENSRRGANAPKLKVDGIVGQKTIDALRDNERRSNPNADSNYAYDVKVRNQGQNTTAPVNKYGVRAGSNYTKKRQEGRLSHANLGAELNRINQTRREVANRPLGPRGKPADISETLRERMRGDPDWARKYRAELKANKEKSAGTTSAASTSKGPSDSSKQTYTKPDRYSHLPPSLRNLSAHEREALQRKFQNENISSTARTYRGGIR